RDRYLTPDTNPALDIGVDSLEWINLSFEIHERTGIDSDEEAVSRIETVCDLLQEVAKASEVITPAISLQQFLEHPERILNERQKRWFQPLVPVSAWTSKILVRLNRSLMYRLFRLHVEGLEHVSQQSQFVLIPNHYSYLDPFLIAAALDGHRLRRWV